MVGVKGVWPYGLNTGGMDRHHHRGTRDTWKKHRQQFGAHWEEDLTRRSKEAVADVKHIERLLHTEGERAWKEVKRTAVERCRAMLQALEQHKKLGGEWRGRIQAALQREVMAHKKKKSMPDGDFIKLLISHPGWSRARVRDILREPAVVRLHPIPKEGERLWVCERNVSPVGAAMLNYVALEDEDWTDQQKAEIEEWQAQHGHTPEGEQPWATSCECFKHFINLTNEDVWRGHVCLWNLEKFRDPAVRELWKKGHKFKLPMADETLHTEIAEGLEGYIDYMRRKHEIPGDAFAAWFGAITRRVQEELALQPGELKPQGGYGMDAVKRVHKDLAVVKEDRGPHNIVAMCKKTYFGARHQYMEAQGTFEDAQETTDQVLQRHEQWHLERGLPSHNRLCYIYGIRKSAKRSLRWISGVRKTVAEKEEARAAKETGKSQGPTEKPKGSVAGAGDELVGVLSTVMHTLQAKDAVRRRRGHAKRCWFVESVEEVAQPLRFAARKVATQWSTARTVEFTTMYPCFDQKLLLERVKKAIAEAWTWEEQEGRDGGVQERAPTETVRLTNDGWKWFDAEATTANLLGAWTLDQVMELVEFVVTNGYISRGGRLRRQVRGFGMG